MYGFGNSFVGIRAAQLQATSARPDAPVVEMTAGDLRAEARARRRRTRPERAPHLRHAVTRGVHRAGDALRPDPHRFGHPAR
ncbi:hypothetical protein H9657_05220 [Cellulomonas sp. Sa3CUA2]|uniref:Uncharacterized protein n=1 Tax=Cellulomonas avistercoris TaxID=2762242 RepID=A0ABR8QB76_9CELL|nr:hypothetical protein [Cellulomonas avistercoris]MBD7917682.1 hypothetical protein [Cellulomonas avistercoris]